MIQTALQLRYAPHVSRPVAAWFVASPDPLHWLEEAVHCCWSRTGQVALAQSGIRFLPVPRSRHKAELAGAVILPPADAAVEICQLRPSARRLPYGQLGGRLYLPVESRLDPELSADELHARFSQDLIYVWHPASGLVALETDGLLSMADLIQVGPPRPRQWNRARAGERLPSRLRGIAPLDPPAMEMVLQLGQDDIGSESKEISNLPPTSDEPRPGIGNVLKRAGLGILAAGIKGIATVAGQASHSNWLDRLKQQTQQKLEHLNRALLSQREKEIRRLLKLLDDSPDEGLKYALPIGGDAHRGLATPGSRLAMRNTDFNLGRLGGGGAADRWDVSWTGQQQLIARYRELANREIQLGRHRRAAYIFGELLADYQAAADALKQGQHWREASVLYRQRLNRPLDAAECLEQGGHWTEAAELYVDLEEHEKAGDIFAKLQQPDEARSQYQIAVAKCRSRSNWLGSARLLEQKLGAIDEAIDELSGAWPLTGQAVVCLRELFALFGRLARHDAAAEKVQRLRDSDTPPRSHIPLVETLAENATNYPDRAVREVAADATRVLASRALTGGIIVDTARVLHAVRSLAPQDRLLSRDCARYQRQRAASPASSSAKPRRRVSSPILIRSTHLVYPDGTWKAEAAIHSGGVAFVAARNSGGVPCVHRYGWSGAVDDYVTWNGLSLAFSSDLILAANPLRPYSLLVQPVGLPLMMPTQTLPPTEDCPFETDLGAVRGMTSALLSACITGQAVTWLLELRQDVPTLLAVGSEGQLILSYDLSSIGAEMLPYVSPSQPVPMHAHQHVYFGLGETMVTFDRGQELKTTRFDQPITSIVGSLPHTRPRLAIAFDEGATVSWEHTSDEGHSQRIATDLAAPRLTFTRGGLVIAADDQRCEVYSTSDRRVELKAELALPSRAIAVLAAVQLNQFGVVFESGQINLYRLA